MLTVRNKLGTPVFGAKISRTTTKAELLTPNAIDHTLQIAQLGIARMMQPKKGRLFRLLLLSARAVRRSLALVGSNLCAKRDVVRTFHESVAA